jgi:hypothetical protein
MVVGDFKILPRKSRKESYENKNKQNLSYSCLVSIVVMELLNIFLQIPGSTLRREITMKNKRTKIPAVLVNQTSTNSL